MAGPAQETSVEDDSSDEAVEEEVVTQTSQESTSETETLVPKAALKREAKHASGKGIKSEEIFEQAAKGDQLFQKIADAYIRRRSTGIVNIVNIILAAGCHSRERRF